MTENSIFQKKTWATTTALPAYNENAQKKYCIALKSTHTYQTGYQHLIQISAFI
jgi:hypothetical protein